MRRIVLTLLACSPACGGDDAGGASTTTTSTAGSTTTTTPTSTTGSTSTTGADPTGSDSTSTSTSTGGSSSTGSTTNGPGSSADTGGGTGLADCQHAWDFSDCDDGWAVGKADASAPGSPSWACGDPSGVVAQGGAHTGVWATNLSGKYGEDESSSLTSPSFSLAGCGGSTLYLTFAHLYELGSGDGATVQVSTDGGTQWTTIEPVWHGYCGGTLGVPWSPPGGEPGFCGGDDETWLHTLVEIDALGGEPDVRVRFVLGSNGIIEQLGWYIDRVAIEAY